MRIDCNIYHKNLGTRVIELYSSNSSCHSIIGSTYYQSASLIVEYKNNINYKKDSENINLILEKFKDIGFYSILHESISDKRIKIKNGLEVEVSKHYNKIGNKYHLFLYEVLRSILTHQILLDSVVDLMKKYDKMNIWDIYYIAHQEIKNKVKSLKEWSTYYDPVPLKYIKYISIENIKNAFYNRSNNKHYFNVQNLWNVCYRKQYKLDLIENKPLSEQLELKEINVLFARLKYKDGDDLDNFYKNLYSKYGVNLRGGNIATYGEHNNFYLSILYNKIIKINKNKYMKSLAKSKQPM